MPETYSIRIKLRNSLIFGRFREIHKLVTQLISLIIRICINWSK